MSLLARAVMTAPAVPFWRVTGHNETGYRSWPAVDSADAAGDLLARLATGPDGRDVQRWEIERHEGGGQAVREPPPGLPLWGTE